MRTAYLLSALLFASPAAADIADIVAEFQTADIIILGEIHDNPLHHLIQSDITAEIQPSAIVFEMFTQDQANIINSLRWDGAGLRSLSDTFEWHKSGWPAFGNYARILEADPEGVVFGLTVPAQDLQDAMFEGAAVVYGLGAEVYNLEDALPVAEQQSREAAILAQNCGDLSGRSASGLIEAERLRTALFADTIIQALDEVGAPVIVITGNAMARSDWGLPNAIHSADPNILVFSLGQFEAIPEYINSFSHTLISNSTYRSNPCLTTKG